MDGVVPKIIKDSVSHPIKNLMAFFLDVFLLATIMFLQGGCLNMYIINHYPETVLPNFLFLIDLISILVAIIGMRITYVYLYKSSKTVHTEETAEFVYSPKKLLRKFPTSKLGLLPLSYISWLVYVSTVLLKIFIIFWSDIYQGLKTTDLLGPQTLNMTIGLTSIVFMLFVEGHNWDFVSVERRTFITTACVSTGLEIFDSVDMLSLLVLPQKQHDSKSSRLPIPYNDVVFLLLALNFILPTLSLYKLSFPDNSKRRSLFISLPIQCLHHFMHMFLVDIPFLAVRLYAWVVFKEDVSMFFMKNLFHIVLSLRFIFPDLLSMTSHSRSKSPADGSSPKAAAEFEDINLNGGI